jgi:predicted MPP superfamily phosphohydrolase
VPRPTGVIGRSLWGLGALAVGALAWGVFVERGRFRLRIEQVPILDPGSEPIRVLHLSDLHMAPWQKNAISWIRALADNPPDLVVGTGDFFGHKDALPAIKEALMPFQGIPGIVVHGSNDREAPRLVNPFRYLAGPSDADPSSEPLDFEGLVDFYVNTLGWHDIDNGAIQMTIKGSELECVGVADAHHNLDHIDQLPLWLEAFRESASETPRRPHRSVTTLGVTHAPYRRVLDALVTHGADLIFAGHTHGGQVCVPGIGALTTNSDLPTSQARGLSLWRHGGRSSYLNVSAGIGTNIYAPVRFACPPEAVLVTLVGGDIGYA